MVGAPGQPGERARRRAEIALWACVPVAVGLAVAVRESPFLYALLSAHAAYLLRRGGRASLAVAWALMQAIFVAWGGAAFGLEGAWSKALAHGPLALLSVVALGRAVRARRFEPVPPPPDDPRARARLRLASLSLWLLVPVVLGMLWPVAAETAYPERVHLVLASLCWAGFLAWLAHGVGRGLYVVGAAAYVGVVGLLYTILGVLVAAGALGAGPVARTHALLNAGFHFFAVVAVLRAVGSEAKPAPAPGPRAS